MPRLHLPLPLSAGLTLELPPEASRHVQVLRLQPGDALTLFNGTGGEWSARIERMGRREVEVQVLAHEVVERELPLAVVLAVGMPANERMDALVEKATELGMAGLQPLITERSVLRLSGERAERRQSHWAGIAASASEQSGRTRVPRIESIAGLAGWLDALPPSVPTERRWVLQPGTAERPDAGWPDSGLVTRVTVLSGPEGGLSEAEVARACRAGFEARGLGPRVLRADTAPLAVLAQLGLLAG